MRMAGAVLPPAPIDHPEWKAFIEAARDIERELRLAQARCQQLEQEVSEVKAAAASLKDEVRQAHEEYDKLYRKAQQPPKQPSQPAGEHPKARAEREHERSRFREIVALMHREVEYLKKVYPLFDLLDAKEAEIRHYRSLLDRVPPSHPDRSTMENAVQAHIAERNEIRMIAEEGRKRLDQELSDMKSLLAVTDPDYEMPQPSATQERSAPRRRAKKTASLG